MIYVITIGVSIALLVLLLRVLRGQSTRIVNVRELASRTEPIDLAAFRNLTSSDEDAYLRSELSPRDFRRVQRLRNLATIEYVGRAARNAALLIRVGEAARGDTNPEIARTANELVNGAVRLRLYAFAVQCKLYADLIAPGRAASAMRFIGAYQNLIDVVANLGYLQQPALVGQIVAAL